MCHIMEFSCSGSPPNCPIFFFLANPLFSRGHTHLATIPVLGDGYHRLFLMELVVNFPILSPSFHFFPFLTLDDYKFLWVHQDRGLPSQQQPLPHIPAAKAFSALSHQFLLFHLHSAFQEFAEIAHLLIAILFPSSSLNVVLNSYFLCFIIV